MSSVFDWMKTKEKAFNKSDKEIASAEIKPDPPAPMTAELARKLMAAKLPKELVEDACKNIDWHIKTNAAEGRDSFDVSIAQWSPKLVEAMVDHYTWKGFKVSLSGGGRALVISWEA